MMAFLWVNPEMGFTWRSTMLRLSMHKCLYFYCTILLCVFHYLVLTTNCLPCVVLGFQMSTSSLPYIGFADGASRSTRNLASSAWTIYAPTNELISLHSVCLGHATNNITKYNAVIELLTDAISLGIHLLVIWLHSHIIVLQLSNVYAIRSPTFLQVFLRIRLL